MRVLTRHLLVQHLILLGMTLALGMVVYLLADVFDRLDDFLEAGVDAEAMLLYFAAKLPTIISQVLPAVFLVAMVIQLGLMERSRELMALSAGGISPFHLVRAGLVAGLVLAVLQIGLSQSLGISGDRAASRIWVEEVRKRQVTRLVLTDVWFKEGGSVVRFEQARPHEHEGKGLTVYHLRQDGRGVEGIIRAESFRQVKGGWLLSQVTQLDPRSYSVNRLPELKIDLRQDLASFVAVDPKTDPSTLSLWQLGNVISSLRMSGSNVERLLTTWHMKISYGFSIPVMALIALAVVSYGRGVYFSLGVSLLGAFAYYALFITAISLGQKGISPPALSAWFANLIFAGFSVLRLMTAHGIGKRKAASPARTGSGGSVAG